MTKEYVLKCKAESIDHLQRQCKIIETLRLNHVYLYKWRYGGEEIIHLLVLKSFNMDSFKGEILASTKQLKPVPRYKMVNGVWQQVKVVNPIIHNSFWYDHSLYDQRTESLELVSRKDLPLYIGMKYVGPGLEGVMKRRRRVKFLEDLTNE